MPNHGFTERAQEALRRAQEIVQQKRHSQLDVEHILFAILADPQGLIPTLLTKLGIDPAALRHKVDEVLSSSPQTYSNYSGLAQIHISRRAQHVVSGAAEEAARLRDQFIGVEHLFLAILREGGGTAARLLVEAGVDRERVEDALGEVRQLFTPDDRSIPRPTANALPLNGSPRPDAQIAIRTALGYAQQSGQALDWEHIVLALLNPRDGLLSRAVARSGGDAQVLYSRLATRLGFTPAAAVDTVAPITTNMVPAMRSILSLTVRAAAGEPLDTVDLILALLNEPGDNPAARFMQEAGVDPNQLVATLGEIQAAE